MAELARNPYLEIANFDRLIRGLTREQWVETLLHIRGDSYGSPTAEHEARKDLWKPFAGSSEWNWTEEAAGDLAAKYSADAALEIGAYARDRLLREQSPEEHYRHEILRSTVRDLAQFDAAQIAKMAITALAFRHRYSAEDFDIMTKPLRAVGIDFDSPPRLEG